MIKSFNENSFCDAQTNLVVYFVNLQEDCGE